jgi:hypothetical protein
MTAMSDLLRWWLLLRRDGERLLCSDRAQSEIVTFPLDFTEHPRDALIARRSRQESVVVRLADQLRSDLGQLRRLIVKPRKHRVLRFVVAMLIIDHPGFDLGHRLCVFISTVRLRHAGSPV